LGVGVVLAAAVAAAAFVARPALSVRMQAVMPPADGVLTLRSDPSGVSVSIDGHSRGSTPLEVSVAPGQHELTFGALETLQRISVTVAPGARSTHYVHLASPVPASSTGALELTSTPSGARVSLDGVARGRTPLRLDDLPAGPHRLSVAHESEKVDQQITVEAGRVKTVVLPLGAVGTSGSAASAGGFLQIASPEIVEVWERGQLIGTSQTARIMLPAGSHPLELVNEDLGYTERRIVSVTAGTTSRVAVQLPQGTLSVNAVPWAEVWIDGRRVGETPLGDIAVAAGRHAVALRHPQLGERRQEAIVRVGASTAITADLRR
jgi:hypothetical protein